MTQTLLAIATFVALIGGIIFGVKKFEERSHSEDNTELITSTPKLIELPPLTDEPLSSLEEQPIEEQPIGDAIEVISEPTPEIVAENPEVAFQSPAIADPWNEAETHTSDAESTQTVLDLGDISQPEAPIDPVEAPSSPEVTSTDTPSQLGLELETPAATTTDEAVSIAAQPEASINEAKAEPSIGAEVEPSEVDAIEPRQEAAEIIIPATIHDPKRPNSEAWENLTQEILAWGQTKDLKHIPKLVAHAAHPDSIVRTNVAIALGQITAGQPIREEVERLIPVLGKLSQDSSLQVRQFAVQALGSIQSQKVLPYLQQALLSPSGSVMKAANDALQTLKLHYGQTPAMQIAQQKLSTTKTKA